jgi:hypothetical protein
MSTSTIADEATILEDQSTRHAAAEYPERTVRAQPTTHPGRTALRWIAGGVTIVAVAIASVLIVADEGTPAEIPDRTEVLDGSATQLDVHGIPTWWSAGASAPRP